MRARLEIPARAIRITASDEVAQQFADISHVFQVKDRVRCRTDCIVEQRPHGIARAVRKLHLELSAAEAVLR
jgi:hypothetical protein